MIFLNFDSWCEKGKCFYDMKRIYFFEGKIWTPFVKIKKKYSEDEIYVLKSDHPGFEEIKEILKRGIEIQKKQTEIITKNIPELKEEYFWINAYPELDIIEFIKIRDKKHEIKLFKDKEKRRKETFQKYEIK